MKKLNNFFAQTMVILVMLVFSALFSPVDAHCDGINGPVVKAAIKALETQNVDQVLIWVKKEHEPEIISTFKNTLEVRKLNEQAKQLADKHFFETVVRLHRKGENASYDGLKYEDTVDPMIKLADHAIEEKDASHLIHHLSDAVKERLQQYFDDVVKSSGFESNLIENGREYVERYIKFIHAVEKISMIFSDEDHHEHEH
jgi:tRNA-dihydrouridine synthase